MPCGHWGRGDDKAISATKIRKSIVTSARRAVPAARGILAQHMCHRVSTADRYYDRMNKVENSIPVSKMIQATMSRASRTYIYFY